MINAILTVVVSFGWFLVYAVLIFTLRAFLLWPFNFIQLTNVSPDWIKWVVTVLVYLFSYLVLITLYLLPLKHILKELNLFSDKYTLAGLGLLVTLIVAGVFWWMFSQASFMW